MIESHPKHQNVHHQEDKQIHWKSNQIKNNIPRKLLGAWIFAPRKIGRPQNSCNNNFLIAISVIIPEMEKPMQIPELDSPCWAPLAGDVFFWNRKIYNFLAESQDPNSNDEIQNAHDDRKSCIVPHNLTPAVKNDEEPNKILGGVTNASRGVLPNIHSMLFPKKSTK